MAEEEGEIEYLEEDEDIVQQYVSTVQSLPVIQDVRTFADVDIKSITGEQQTPLLVERKAEKRKHTVEEEDSDYDPEEDLKYLNEQRKKRRLYAQKKIQQKTSHIGSIVIKPNPKNAAKTYESKLKNLPNLIVKKQKVAEDDNNKPKAVQMVQKKFDIDERRKFVIKIPDYDDPICLPVQGMRTSDYDLKKISNWNNLCLDKYKKAHSSSKQKIVSSSRTVVLRNVRNKAGRIETTIWGKSVFTSDKGQYETDMFQSILPRVRERKPVKPYGLAGGGSKYFKHTFEAILTKEEQKDGDALVVYKPREMVSALYRFIGDRNIKDTESEVNDEKRVLRELTCCRVCAACYQTSWRGVRRRENVDQTVKCHICKRSFVSLYNLLTHVKTAHSSDDVKKTKKKFAETFASMVDYHYKCRICQEQFGGIKILRKHIAKHQGVDIFKCEVGNHMAK